jgi:hypothetical protein
MKRDKAKNIKRLSEKDLEQTLRKRVLAILIVLTIGILGFFVFAPQIGSLFGYFSKHRNDPGYVPTPKPMPPVFINAPKATNKDKITLMGKALSGATVKIFVNGPEKGSTTAGNDGIFTFPDIQLNSGTNTIFAKSYDNNGNESDSSEFLVIVYDKEPPKITIESPKDGETIKNLNKRIEIKGKISEKADISINERTAIQNSDLSFNYLLSVNEGEVKINIEATDLAGNKSSKEITVKYSKSQ